MIVVVVVIVVCIVQERRSIQLLLPYTHRVSGIQRHHIDFGIGIPQIGTHTFLIVRVHHILGKGHWMMMVTVAVGMMMMAVTTTATTMARRGGSPGIIIIITYVVAAIECSSTGQRKGFHRQQG